MRSHGLVELPVGYGDHDHVCWSYAHDDERTDAALAWLREGAERGCLPVYVGPDGSRMLQLWSDAGQSVPLGAFSVDDLYDLSRPIDAPEQLAVYAAQVALLSRRAEKAQEDGTTIRLVGANYQVRRLWELLQLDSAVMEGVC